MMKSSIWKDAPLLAIPDWPALFCDSSDLWLCYAMAPSKPERYAIVQFIGVIDHRLSPINDEGIGQHPCSTLEWYAFNEITGSPDTLAWAGLGVRHWAVTFKDNTLDVIASDAKVVAAGLDVNRPTKALFSFLRDKAS